MHKLVLLLFLFLSSILYAKSDSTKVFQGYCGGMMLHTGYLFGENPSAILPSGNNITPQGLTKGIGGALRIYLLNHLRVGCEGFISTMNSNHTDMRQTLKSGSYIRSGWGGLCADACWRLEKFWPYIGGSIGGGTMRSLSVVDGCENDWKPEPLAMLTKQSFCYVNPYIGIDWCMTNRVHITFRFDWMLALAHQQILYPTGPRLYFGFMFCH